MAYTTTSYMPLKMPTPGTREPANIALLNENAVVLSGHDHSNGKGLPVTVLRAGLEANRPAAGNVGAVYLATDTGQFYVDTGTAWASFLTSGGASTVTGWTLVDPIIRDTLQFGPEGGAGVDASITRVAALSLQTDSKFGVGVTPDPQWHPNLRIVQFGSSGALVGYAGTDAEEVQFTGNTIGRSDSKQYAILPNSPANRLRLSQGALIFETAPAVAAGLEQTLTTRLTAAASGTLTLVPTLGSQSIDLQQQATDVNAVPSIMIRRGAPASQHQTIRFQNGASLGDFDIGRRAGSDDFRFMFWNGATLTDRMALSPNGTLTISPTTGQNDLQLTGIGILHTTGNLTLRAAAAIEVAPAAALFRSTRDNADALGSSDRRWSQLFTGAINGGPGNIYLRGTGAVYCSMTAPYLAPESDAGQNLGYPGTGRWANTYLYYAPTIGSHADMKENFAPLDPSACVAAVLTTDWISYDYKQQPFTPPAPDPADAYDEHDDNDTKAEKKARRDAAEATAREHHAKMLEDTDFSRHQKGYALGHPTYKVADLFGTIDRANRSDGADLAVVACALQDALRRLAVLEGTDAAPA